MDIVQVLAVWLHTLAFVLVLGYYGLLGRVVLPALRRSLDARGQVAALAAIERRALPLVVLSVVLFALTGTYLLVVDPEYAGLGHAFASTWTTLMVLKHALVVAMVALGVTVDYYIRETVEVPDDAARESAIRRVELSAEGATGLGAIVVLLTVAAQVAA